jgi:uncharacterized protein (DUF342 family)
LRPPDRLGSLVERTAAALRAATCQEPAAPGGLLAAVEAAGGRQGLDAGLGEELRAAAAELRSYFRAPAGAGEGADAFCHVEVTDRGLCCLLTIYPPRRGGRQLAAEQCFRELDAAGVVHGLEDSAVRAAVAEVQSGGDIAYRVPVAHGTPPGEPRRAQLELNVPHVAKSDLRLDATWLQRHLPACLGELRENQPVGRYHPPVPGEPGTNVRGKPIPARDPAALRVELGPGLARSDTSSGLIHTVHPGQVVLDTRRLDVVPMFLAEGDYGPDSPEIAFRGLVVVLGNLSGQKVDADDLIVAGNCERSEITSAGDVFIGGGVIGKKEGRIYADGRVAARHVSDAEVEALGDIIVTNTITYSEVTSNSRVVVTAERGSIVGGRVGALRGIEARSIGSDFGTYTVTAVGRDFLTAKRLQRLREVIRLHEDNLKRIETLKAKMSRARVDVKKLSPAKQDIYLGVLRKEVRSQQELESLARRRDRLNSVLSDVLEATVRIREELFPPVRVEIADAIREIEERLRQVVVFRDRNRGIVARPDVGSAAPDHCGGN